MEGKLDEVSTLWFQVNDDVSVQVNTEMKWKQRSRHEEMWLLVTCRNWNHDEVDCDVTSGVVIGTTTISIVS